MIAYRHRRSIKKPQYPRFIFFLIVFVLLSTFLFLVLRLGVWKSQSKLAVATIDAGKVNIIVFDKEAQEITKIVIPGNVEVEAAQNLGTWKLGSIWELGGGELLTRTLVRNFSFPVYSWSDGDFVDVFDGNIFLSLVGCASARKSNLKPRDWLKLSFFSSNIKNYKRKALDLSETGYLTEARLVDGQEGYRVNKNVPPSLSSVFAQSAFVDAQAKVGLIINGYSGSVGFINRTLEVLGSKVVQVTQSEDQNFICRVKGGNRTLTEEIVNVFGCEEEFGVPVDGLDATLMLGSGFASVF